MRRGSLMLPPPEGAAAKALEPAAPGSAAAPVGPPLGPPITSGTMRRAGLGPPAGAGGSGWRLGSAPPCRQADACDIATGQQQVAHLVICFPACLGCPPNSALPTPRDKNVSPHLSQSVALPLNLILQLPLPRLPPQLHACKASPLPSPASRTCCESPTTAGAGPTASGTIRLGFLAAGCWASSPCRPPTGPAGRAAAAAAAAVAAPNAAAAELFPPAGAAVTGSGWMRFLPDTTAAAAGAATGAGAAACWSLWTAVGTDGAAPGAPSPPVAGTEAAAPARDCGVLAGLAAGACAVVARAAAGAAAGWRGSARRCAAATRLAICAGSLFAGRGVPSSPASKAAMLQAVRRDPYIPTFNYTS